MSARSAEEVFEGAGSRPGLEAWRIEKTARGFIEPVANAEALSGLLHSGDAYIFLSTCFDGGGVPPHKLFIWEGAESHLERGAAAELAVELDTKILRGLSPPAREVQTKESASFIALLGGKSLVYTTGGHSGGFHHVAAGAAHADEEAPARLLQISGEKRGSPAVVSLADATAALDPTCCYVLDSPGTAAPIVWLGGSPRAVDKFAAATEAGRLATDGGHSPHNVVTLTDGDELPAAFTAGLELAAAAQ